MPPSTGRIDAGDVTGGGRREKDRRAGHVRRLTDSLHRRGLARSRRRTPRAWRASFCEGNGPGAMAFTVIFGAKRLGEVARELVHRGLRGRVRERVHGRHVNAVDRADVDHPRRALARCPCASSSGRRNFVRWKTPFTLSESTRSHAFSSYSSIGAPHVAPALLTRTSRWSSRPRSRWRAAGTRPRSRGRPAGKCTSRSRRAPSPARHRPRPCATRCRPWRRRRRSRGRSSRQCRDFRR